MIFLALLMMCSRLVVYQKKKVLKFSSNLLLLYSIKNFKKMLYNNALNGRFMYSHPEGY